jgi:hypothetical protein
MISMEPGLNPPTTMRRKKKERRGWRKKKRKPALPNVIPSFVAGWQMMTAIQTTPSNTSKPKLEQRLAKFIEYTVDGMACEEKTNDIIKTTHIQLNRP